MKRLTMNQVAKASLKANRKAYVSLAIGIFLSVLLDGFLGGFLTWGGAGLFGGGHQGGVLQDVFREPACSFLFMLHLVQDGDNAVPVGKDLAAGNGFQVYPVFHQAGADGSFLETPSLEFAGGGVQNADGLCLRGEGQHGAQKGR